MICRIATIFCLSLGLLAAVSFPSMAQPAASGGAVDGYAPGTRSGPFVATERNLGELAAEGYEIKTSFGRSLILQKEGSVFSCEIPPSRETLSYASYFVCFKLEEERPAADEDEARHQTKK